MSTRPLRIAMVGLRGIPATHGGIEGAVDALATRLAKRGHEVTVYSRHGYSDTRQDSYRGVHLRYLPQINTKHLEAASHTFLAMSDALARQAADVVHVHAVGPALFSFMPRLARTPCVATVHALDSRREKWGRVATRVLRLGERVAATVPDRTIAVSRTVKEHLEREYGREVTFIPNGVDPAALEPPSPVSGLEPSGYALFLGRIVPEKEVHTLIRAFARAETDMRLAIAGPGTHTGEYVREVERLAAADPRVILLGPRYGGEKTWLLENAWIFVQPSKLEGLPIALMEAMACGRHCLVSDIPEHLEVVRSNGATYGEVFRAGDQADLATKLASALSEPERSGGRADAARQHVLERYGWDPIVEQTERVYFEALGAG